MLDRLEFIFDADIPQVDALIERVTAKVAWGLGFLSHYLHPSYLNYTLGISLHKITTSRSKRNYIIMDETIPRVELLHELMHTVEWSNQHLHQAAIALSKDLRQRGVDVPREYAFNIGETTELLPVFIESVYLYGDTRISQWYNTFYANCKQLLSSPCNRANPISKPYQFIGSCDRVRRCPGNEELWHQMMANKVPISPETLEEHCQVDDLLDEDETLEEFMCDDSSQCYQSIWGDKLCMFIRTCGFEFIFVAE